MEMQTHAALGLSCVDPDTCEHAGDREGNRAAARRAALRVGTPSYDPAMIGIHGEPDFDNLPADLAT